MCPATTQLEPVGAGSIQGSILDLSLEAARGPPRSLHDHENLNSDFGTTDVTQLSGIFLDESGRALTNGSDMLASFDAGCCMDSRSPTTGTPPVTMWSRPRSP